MSTATGESPNIRDRYYFLLRRLHSLSGIIPVGVFLVMHLTVNSTILFGGDEFQARVDQIHSLGSFLVPVEIVGIFLPILFHAVLGIVIIMSGRSNAATYGYGANWRYTLQRWTGMIAFVFILAHLWHMHWLGKPFGGSYFDPHDAPNTVVRAMQMKVFWAPLYVLGVVASVYHFCNGLWTAAITWGLTVGRQAQRKFGYAMAVFGLLLTIGGVATVSKVRRMEAPASRAPAAAHVDASDAAVADGPRVAVHQ